MKNASRKIANLPPLHEDTHVVVRRIRANSPPATPADNFLNRAVRSNNRHSVFGQGRQGPRQGSLAGGRLAVQQQIARQQLQQQLQQREMQRRLNPSFNLAPNESGGVGLNSDQLSKELDATGGQTTPRPGSPIKNDDATDATQTSSTGAAQIPQTIISQQIITGIMNSFSDVKVLPWRPKVRTGDIEV